MRKIILNLDELNQEDSFTQGEPQTKVVEKDSAEKMFDYINDVMNNENYGIGLHSIRVHSTQEKEREDVLDSVMKNGLEMDKGKKILSTVSSFGTHTKITQDHLKQRIMEYSYGKQSDTRQSIIVLVPSKISNSQGKQVYLGFPSYDTECHGNDYRTASVLDTLCINKDGEGKIPSEFIVGYYTSNGEQINFVENPNYIKFLPTEKKDAFFEEMEGRLQGKYKTISDAVIAGDIQTLEELSKEEQSKISMEIKKHTRANILERGLNQQTAETLSRNTVQIKQDDSATQALGYVEKIEERKSQDAQPALSGKKRRILLDTYRDVKLSDLTVAKESLREDIEETEKNNEGKEI